MNHLRAARPTRLSGSPTHPSRRHLPPPTYAPPGSVRRPRGLSDRLLALPLLLLLAALLAGCASAVALGPPVGASGGDRPALLPHLAVHDVVLVVWGHRVRFVGHAAIDAERGLVRAHAGTESGLTGLDLTVRGHDVEVHTRGAFAEIPLFEERCAQDLARLFGASSIWYRPVVRPEGGDVPSVGRPGDEIATDEAGVVRTVPGDGPRPRRLAVSVHGGRWVLVERTWWETREGPLRVVLLGADRVPEAEILYTDFDADGIPRHVELEDLDHGHTLTLDVAQVELVDEPVPGPRVVEPPPSDEDLLR